MQLIAQNSYWSAKHLGDAGLEAMRKRGRMQEGMVADITIFNPETIRDNATYQEQRYYSVFGYQMAWSQEAVYHKH